MSSKAINDIERRRNGLLSWARTKPGWWIGSGSNPSVQFYDVMRNHDGSWRCVFKESGITIDACAPMLRIAQNSCQRHFTLQVVPKLVTPND